MKKEMKIILLSVIIAIVLLLILTTTVRAETINIPATFSEILGDDSKIRVTFTLPETISGVTQLEENEWTVNGDTATKDMNRGATYYYEQTDIEDNVYKVVIAVPMKYSLDNTILLNNYSDITVENTAIATVEGTTVTPVSVGNTKLHAKKTTTNVEYVWDLTIVDDSADEAYYRLNSWTIQISGEDNPEVTVDNELNLQINAVLNDGITAPTTPANPFNVEWTVDDDSIVALTDTNGDAITNSGKIASAKIKGLKAGTTTIRAKVTMGDLGNSVLNFSKTIKVNEATSTDNQNNTDANSNGNTTEGNNNEDSKVESENKQVNTTDEKNGTEATENISQTGSNVAIVLVVIAGFAIVAFISKRRLSKNKF